MAGQEKWYFVREQLQNSPSRKCGLDADKELAYRQQAANLIQDMGQRLQVSQLCINTGIVYMHRFYAFHSFTEFHRNAIAAAALFLAAKVEEQPRKLEYVIKVAHVCLHRGESANALSSEHYQEQAQDLVFNENVLLQTLGFDVAIDHPHTHVVRTCHLVKAPKDLAQTSYFMASNSLHLTTMCLQYRPTVVACFCIHLASKWSNWAIPQSNEGRHWFSYVDRSVTSELLERLTAEFLHIFDKCPSRLRKKMMTMCNNSGGSPHSGSLAAHPSSSAGVASSPFHKNKPNVPPPSDDFDKAFDREYEREKRRPQAPGGYVPATTTTTTPAPTTQKIDYNLYREKREREERERRQRELAQRPPGPPNPRPPPTQPHQRPTSHNKPHHNWGGHHKPPHHKPHEHRPRPQPPQNQPNQNQPALQNNHEHQRTRPPSLFSPENTTSSVAAASAPRRPQPQPQNQSQPPPQLPPPKRQLIPPTPEVKSPIKKRPTEVTNVVREMQPPAILSPFSSPPPKEMPKPHRPKNPSISEPELIPVVKKLDETPGFENVIRDSQRGAIKTKLPEMKRPEPIRPLNGIETDPTLVSNLLKESLAKPVPITVQIEKKSPIKELKKEPEVIPPPIVIQPPSEPIATNQVTPQVSNEESDHRHKKEKKKKEKHKHKDRDKSKEDRKKHKKDKERERKEKKESTPQTAPPEALRITIPREKLSLSPGLKIKIPKDRLAAPPPPSSGIKIKIPKEVLETSRKRTHPSEIGPPQKFPRQNGAPHKVGWRHQFPPYYVVRPPPTFFGYGLGYNGFQVPDYYFNVPPMYTMNPPPHLAPQPPLPAMPPPPLPPPPPE